MATEEEILDGVRERKSDEYVEENRELILMQARLVGELKDDGNDGEAADDEDTE
jgi:hypothetical protein